jgi:hypothetical protein
MKDKLFFLNGLAIVLGLVVVLAQEPKKVSSKEAQLDALLSTSAERIRKVNMLSKTIDKIAHTTVSDMHARIESLEVEKKALAKEKAALTAYAITVQAVADSLVVAVPISPDPFPAPIEILDTAEINMEPLLQN